VTGGANPLVVATRNAGKLRELAPMIAAAGLRPCSLDELGIVHRSDEESIEVFDTFEANSMAKARYYRRRVEESGDAWPVLADDSGLQVDALGGEPGVHSKRWGADASLTGAALDASNNARLIAALAGVTGRRARFVCVAAIAWRGGEIAARGETVGTILDAPRGTHGFGYDPLFLSDDLGATLAEATVEGKSAVSHRARAVKQVLRELPATIWFSAVDPAGASD
jgi:XTP/dITP diphosphohydrolase